MKSCSLVFGLGLFFGLLLTIKAAGTPNPDANRIDLNSLFKALLIDVCNQKCSDDLKADIIKALGLVDVYENLENLCTGYTSLSTCEKQRFCPKPSAFVRLAISGVEKLCSAEVQQQLKANETCLKTNADVVSQTCDKQCNFVKSLADYSNEPVVKQGVNTLAIIGQLDGVCQGFNCYFTCFQNSMNKKCPGAATTITSSMLSPFYQLADFVNKLSPSIQQMAREKMPESCGPLLDKTHLDQIWQSKQQSVRR